MLIPWYKCCWLDSYGCQSVLINHRIKPFLNCHYFIKINALESISVKIVKWTRHLEIHDLCSETQIREKSFGSYIVSWTELVESQSTCKYWRLLKKILQVDFFPLQYLLWFRFWYFEPLFSSQAVVLFLVFPCSSWQKSLSYTKGTSLEEKEEVPKIGSWKNAGRKGRSCYCKAGQNKRSFQQAWHQSGEDLHQLFVELWIIAPSFKHLWFTWASKWRR